MKNSMSRDNPRHRKELEERRLVEKWIFKGLSDEELALLPADVKARAQSYFRGLIDDGLCSAEEGGWLDGPESVETVLRKVTARQDSRGTVVEGADAH